MPQTWNGYPVIDDDTWHLHYAPTLPDGSVASRGAVPRDYSVQPEEVFDSPSGMALIDPSEYDARIEEQERLRSSLEHVYLPGGDQGGPLFVCLEQNGHGFCWSYSTGHALMMLRAHQNQPLVRLNPHGPAAIIKGGRDEGGWCGLSAQWAMEHGYPSEGHWPVHSLSLRNDTPTARENMKLHRVAEGWIDLTRQAWDRNLTLRQLHTCLLLNIPCPVDFQWWGHSVCAIRLVKVEAGSYGLLILNSWKGWGRHGLGVLRGDKAVPMGAVAPRVTTPSAA